MGEISFELLLPAHLVRPDDASQIATWEPEIHLSAMCVGFQQRGNGVILFEGETPIQLRPMNPRIYQYRYPGDQGTLRIVNRWRVEVVADPKNTHLRPGDKAVLARVPYGINWIQTAEFKRGLHRPPEERTEPTVPQLKDDEDAVDWIDREFKYDLWETGARYIAGIGFPNGFLEESRNIIGKVAFGVCPDFERLVREVFQTNDVQKMLHQTRENEIEFWYQDADIAHPPRLYPVVIEEAETLMYRSIQQALAGPSSTLIGKSSETWTGQPVSKLVRWIYCGHLNERNRAENVRLQHEVSIGDDLDRFEKRGGNDSE